MALSSPDVGESLDTIESSILPALSSLLDGLLDSATLARPGADADRYATELRYTASHLDSLSRLIAAVAVMAQPAAATCRISA